MILFHYALGAKSQFHLVYVFVFFLPSPPSLFLGTYRNIIRQKKSLLNEIILQHTSISNTNDVSISMKYNSL